MHGTAYSRSVGRSLFIRSLCRVGMPVLFLHGVHTIEAPRGLIVQPEEYQGFRFIIALQWRCTVQVDDIDDILWPEAVLFLNQASNNENEMVPKNGDVLAANKVDVPDRRMHCL